MNETNLIKKHIPMTESTYYVLLSLFTPRHGYGIMQYVDQMSNGRLKLGPGTLYGILSKMESQRIIYMTSEEEKRKIYQLTDIGVKLIKAEIRRLQELFENGIHEVSVREESDQK